MLDRSSDGDLRWLVGDARLGLWIWSVQADEVCWVSQVGEIYGVEPSDFPENFAAFEALLPPDDENLQAKIFSSMDQESGRFEFEHSIIRPDGSVGWIQNSGCVEFDENRNPSRIGAVALDITEQKQAELSLQTREDQFRRFSELTSDYIYEVDMRTLPFVPNVVVGSYQRVVGYNESELAEKGGWTGIMHSEDLVAGQEVSKQLHAGVSTIHEYRITNKDGEVRWLCDHACPVLQDGELVQIIGGVKDITETKALRDQLLQAQKHEAMAHLVSAVAHDFNNLLVVVMASTELMTQDGDADEFEELKADNLIACDRAAELTRKLLAFTRKDLPQTQTVRLSDTVRETSGILRRAVGEQIEVRMDFSSEVNDIVDIDPGHLQLVLLNLARNSRAAMNHQGELVLSVSAVDPDAIHLPEMNLQKNVLLEVTDSGCGITEENIARVFDPFFTTKSAGEGCGIGLATCWQIIDRAGGAIHVKSELGHGTTFSIHLPTVNKPVREKTTPVANVTLGGTERILVVDDDDDVRRTTVRILESFGYEVCGVDCGQAARQAVAEANYDMLLVDVRLPDGDGCSLVKELKKTNPNVSALLVSGYIDDGVRARVRNDGYRVLAKPFSGTALARSIRATLQCVEPIESVDCW